MNKLISANYWFGCDWVFYEVGYLGLRAGQLSLACAVVYLWNTGYLRVTRLRLYPGVQQRLRGSDLTTVVRTEAYKKNVTRPIWELLLSIQHQEHLNRIQW